MKIRVVNKKDKVNIRLSFPSSILKTKLVTKNIFKNSKENIDKETISKMYKILKEYIKENGHFTLVEVVSKDGTYIKISV